MKPFRFRLESVRQLRALHEQQARTILAGALRELARARTLAAQARQEAEDLGSRLAEQVSTTFRPADQAAGLAAWRQARDAVAQREQAVIDATQDHARAHQAWLERRGELRAMDRLRERQRLLHRETQERAEQAQLDELAGLTATRPSF